MTIAENSSPEDPAVDVDSGDEAAHASPSPVDEQATSGDDLFEEFLATGTLRRATVGPLYADQDAADEMERLMAEAEKLAKNNPAGERDITAPNPLLEIERQMVAAHERFEASRAEFVVVALTDEIRDQLADEFPEDKPPRMLGRGATEKHKADWDRKFEQWKSDVAAVHTVKEATALAYAIERFETAKGTRERVLGPDGRVVAPALTVEQLERMFAAPYGYLWRRNVVATFNRVSDLRGEPERPFLPGTSTSDPD